MKLLHVADANNVEPGQLSTARFLAGVVCGTPSRMDQSVLDSRRPVDQCRAPVGQRYPMSVRGILANGLAAPFADSCAACAGGLLMHVAARMHIADGPSHRAQKLAATESNPSQSGL